MHAWHRGLRLGSLLLTALVASSCATAVRQSTLAFEQHTLRIPLTVSANGSVSLAEQPPLTGRIDLSPILQAEGVPVPPTTATTTTSLHLSKSKEKTWVRREIPRESNEPDRAHPGHLRVSTRTATISRRTTRCTPTCESGICA